MAAPRVIKGPSVDLNALTLPVVARNGGTRRWPSQGKGSPIDVVFGEMQTIPATKDVHLKNVEMLAPNRQGNVSAYSLDAAHYDGRRGNWSFEGLMLPPDKKNIEEAKEELMEALTTGLTDNSTRAQRSKWHEYAKRNIDYKDATAGMTKEQLQDYYRQNSLHDLSPDRRAFLQKRIMYLDAAEKGQKAIDDLNKDKQQKPDTAPAVKPAVKPTTAPVTTGATQLASTTPLAKKSSKLQPTDIAASAIAGGATGLAAYGLSGFVPSIQKRKLIRALIGLTTGVATGAGSAWLLTREKKEASLKKKADPGDPWDYDSVIYVPSGSGWYSNGEGGGKINGAAVITKNKEGGTTEIVTDGVAVGGGDKVNNKPGDTATIRVKHTDADGNVTLSDTPMTTKEIDINQIRSLDDALKLIVASKGVESAMNQDPKTLAAWRNRIIKLREEKIDEAAKQLRDKGKNLKAFGLKHKDELLSSGMGLAAGSLGYIGSYAGLGMIPWFKNHKGIRFLASLIAGTGLGIGAGKLTHKQLTRHYKPSDRASWNDVLGTAGAAATDASDALRMSGHDITYKDVQSLMDQLPN